MPKKDRTNICFTRRQVEILLRWYGCAHHFEKCRKPVGECHRLKNMLWNALSAMDGKKFEKGIGVRERREWE